MNKMIIAGVLAAALMFSALGAVAITRGNTADYMTQDEIDQYSLTDGAVDTEVNDPDAQYLLTEEQIENMKTTAQDMQDNHSTRTEIRETVQIIAHDYVQENLESYGLAEEEIVEIQAKITELLDKMLEIRETAFDLWEQDMNRQDIRAELQPLIDQAHEIRGELKDLLDQYDIIPPEIGHPGMGGGHGRGHMGRFRRLGRAGRADGTGRPGGFGGPRP